MNQLFLLAEKIYAVGMSLFAAAFLLFSFYGTVTVLLDRSWQLVLIMFFLLLLALAVSCFACNKLRTAFANKKLQAVTKAGNFLTMTAFVYMTLLFSCMYFFEGEEEALRLAVFGGVASLVSIIAYKISVSID